MKHILLLTTIIGLSACAANVDQIRCPIELSSGKIIEGGCSDGGDTPSGILDGNPKPTDPEDNPKDDDEVKPDHPSEPDTQPEPPKDKPKEHNHNGHNQGHSNGGFGDWEGKGRKDHKDW